jgi:hypothetical protein
VRGRALIGEPRQQADRLGQEVSRSRRRAEEAHKLLDATKPKKGGAQEISIVNDCIQLGFGQLRGQSLADCLRRFSRNHNRSVFAVRSPEMQDDCVATVDTFSP